MRENLALLQILGRLLSEKPTMRNDQAEAWFTTGERGVQLISKSIK